MWGVLASSFEFRERDGVVERLRDDELGGHGIDCGMTSWGLQSAYRLVAEGS
jgi:hypothetical protein